MRLKNYQKIAIKSILGLSSPNGSGLVQMGEKCSCLSQIGPIYSKLFLIGPIWSVLVRIGSKLFVHDWSLVLIGSNLFLGSKKLTIGLYFFWLIQTGYDRSKLVLIFWKEFLFVPFGPGWSCLVWLIMISHNSPNLSKRVPIRPSINWVQVFPN